MSEVAPDAYTSGVYSTERPRLAPLVRTARRATLRQVVRLLRGAGLPPRARVLDAGAGSGALVALMRDAGLDAYGIDPRPRPPSGGPDAAAAVLPAAIEEHEARDRDAVVLWHVLEHVADPAAVLGRVRSWVGPRGVLLVGVPNVASLQARIAGGAWFHLDVPRHRTHFSRSGLRALLDRAGFEIVAERHFIAEHNLHGMWFALLTRLGMTPGFPFHLLKRNIEPRAADLLLLLVAGPLLVVPALLLEAAAAVARRGGTIALVAQRRA